MTRLRVGLIALLLHTVSAAVSAQPAAPSARAAGIKGAIARAPGLGNGWAIESDGVRFIYQATTTDKLATATVAHVWRGLRAEAAFKGHIGDGQDSTLLADLDGLRSKSSFKGSVMWTTWGLGDPAGLVTGPCNAYRNRLGQRRRAEVRHVIEAEIRQQLEDAFPPPARQADGFAESWQKKERELYATLEAEVDKKMEKEPVLGCSLLTLRDLAKAAAEDAAPSSPEEAKARIEIVELSRLLDPGTLWFLGADASYAPESFEFVTVGDSLGHGEETHTSRAMNVSVSVLTSSNVTYTASIGHQRAYTAGTETQLCSPAGPAATSTCATTVVGGPVLTEKWRGTAGIRWFPSPRFAMDLRVNRDFTKKDTGIELPLSFLQSPEGGLAGGVTVGYRTSTKAFTAVLFVGGISTLVPR